MSAMGSQITSLTIVYSTVHSSGADQRKHQSSVPLVFVRGIHPWPMNSPHKGPVMRKMFPFDDVIMNTFRVMHNDRQFGNIFKCIFLMKKVEFRLKFHWSLFVMDQLIISQCEKYLASTIFWPWRQNQNIATIYWHPPLNPPTPNTTHTPTPTPLKINSKVLFAFYV